MLESRSVIWVGNLLNFLYLVFSDLSATSICFDEILGD